MLCRCISLITGICTNEQINQKIKPMKKFSYLTVSFLIYSFSAVAQGKIKDGTIIGSPSLPDPSAVFEVESNNKGLLMPRVSLTNTAVWGLAGSPISGGITVYNTNPAMTGTKTAPIITGGIGVYYWNGTIWVAGSGQQKIQADSTYWSLRGNTGLSTTSTIGTTVGTSNFLGTNDATNLSFGTNGLTRMIIGQNANAYGGSLGSGTGSESFSWGQQDTVSGIASAAFGTRNKVESNSSIISGRDNKLSSTSHYSAVFGDANNDSAFNTLVAGSGNYLNQQANASAVFGLQNRIENSGGAVTSLLAANLISGGNNQIDLDGILNISGNLATHFNIVAGQSNNLTTSANCAVFGYQNDMRYSDGSTIGGFNNTIERARSSAIFGYENIDSSSQSFITGQGNIINSSMVNSCVIGRFNAPISNTLFTIGNGSSDASRSNAFVVYSTSTSGASVNGLIVLIPSLPTYASDAAATADASLPGGGLYRIGNDIRIK